MYEKNKLKRVIVKQGENINNLNKKMEYNNSTLNNDINNKTLSKLATMIKGNTINNLSTEQRSTNYYLSSN